MKHWKDIFAVAEVTVQRDWGPDHPMTGDWIKRWDIFYIQEGTDGMPDFDRKVPKLRKCSYSSELDAHRGAAHIFRKYQRDIEKALLG